MSWADSVELLTKLGSFGLSIAAIIYAWFSSRRKDVDVQFRDGRKRMEESEKRIAKLEQEVDVMPGKDEVHRLELGMSEMVGEMKAVAAHMAGQKDVLKRLETVVTRHEDHLLGGNNK